ncbi:MAG: GIY-YIG nuclease family protein [Gammaproteobacteria bacterium]|nr:GIY-YIG nuclease family protein [Gammaproteobacteria bacterium]
MPQNDWFVYIVRCADNSLYTGVTTNIERRVFEHNSQTKRGAKYTRSRQPVSVVYWEQAANRSIASQREFAIKKMDRPHKNILIKNLKKSLPDVA